MSDDLELTDEQKKKVEEFPWKENEESDFPMEGSDFALKLRACADRILEIAFANLSLDNYSGTSLSVFVPASSDSLLQETYSSKWSNESRCQVRNVICLFTESVAHSYWQEQFEEKLNSLLPSPEFVNKLSDIIMIDNPVSVEGESDNLIELELTFEKKKREN